MSKLIRVILISLTITCARSHVVWETANNLQPVHGLYVMPSVDGTTGDLYVAATEENGSKSQWLTDQPVNFLPTENQATVPLTLTPSLATSSQEDKVNTQKRAILTTPPIKYAYALSTTGSEGSTTVLPYPYTAPSPAKAEESNLPPCATSTPYYSPFQYFYPQMMSAIANAFNTHNKENSATEDSKTSNLAQAALWPHTYAYPFQYVMVDPSAWTSQITTAATPSKILEENDA